MLPGRGMLTVTSIMDVVEVAAICALLVRRKRRRKHKYWVHPIYSERLTLGKFYTSFERYRNFPDKFFSYYRMSINSFDELLALVGPSIAHPDTSFRRSVPEAERLAVTLRYLSTGMTMNAVSHEYCLGVKTVQTIVQSTCVALWEVLLPVYMNPNKTNNDWLDIAEKFHKRTNFPNAIGALDGKHIRIIQPSGTGSTYFNFKKFFSLVLLAWVDSDYSFVYVDIGGYGTSGDSTIFNYSAMGQNLKNNTLNIPASRKLPNDDEGQTMPFVVLADSAFGLTTNIMRPYPKKKPNQLQRIFNYRHTRGRRVVECAFGILASKWRIFYRPLNTSVPVSEMIVKACCVLHNFVRVKDGINFDDTLYECPLESTEPCRVRGAPSALTIRHYFARYFTSPQGAIPWQYEKI